jgi:hypothetical protein
MKQYIVIAGVALAAIAIDRMLGLTNKLQPATKAAGAY